MRVRAVVLLLLCAGSAAFVFPTKLSLQQQRVSKPFVAGGMAAGSRCTSVNAVMDSVGRQPEPQRQSKREQLIAKGLAGLVLLRYAYSSPWAAVLAILLGFVVIISPVMAIEAILLAGVCCLLGVSAYWPSNFFVFLVGSAGIAGCLHGCLVWWGTRMENRHKRDDGRTLKTSRPVGSVPEDESGGLVALVAGALAAAIIGALP